MERLDNKTTSSAVAAHIEHLIFSECMMPNTKIPSERALSDRLGVSRAIVREALRELKGRGIIHTQQGRGSFVNCLVTEPPEQEVVDNLANQAQSLYDVLEVREQLESQAAYLAAQRATQGDKYRITRAFEAMNAKRWDANLDHAFHQAILDACHNPVLIHTLASLKRLTLKSIEAAVENMNHRPTFRQQFEKQHRQIYSAVQSGQAEWARKIASQHVRYLSDKLHQIQMEHLITDRSKTESN